MMKPGGASNAAGLLNQSGTLPEEPVGMQLSNIAQRARQALVPKILARLTLAHIGAYMLIGASAVANTRYGLSLGHDMLDKVALLGAALGADAGLASGPILYAKARGLKRYATGAFVALSFIFAMLAGLNFSAEVRGEHLGKRAAAERTDTTRVNELSRIDARLKEIGTVPAAGTLQAQMDAITSDRRADNCKTMDGPYTKANCPKYFQLKGQLALSVEKDKLATKRNPLVDGVLNTDIVVTADPAAASLAVYLAKLNITIDPANVPPWLNLLFVMIMVAGGPTLLCVAESQVATSKEPPPPPADKKTPEQPAVTANDNSPSVVIRPRKLAAISPAAAKALSRLEDMGGTAHGKSQGALATVLGLPRTSYRRVVPQWEAAGVVKTSHDLKGYTVALAA